MKNTLKITHRTKLAIGMFSNNSRAKQAIEKLKNIGFAENKIFLLTQDNNTISALKDDINVSQKIIGNKSNKGTKTGAIAGILVGTFTGILVGLGAIATGPNHPTKRVSARFLKGLIKGESSKMAGSRLNNNIVITNNTPFHPKLIHWSKGTIKPSKTKIGRVKKRLIASCTFSSCALSEPLIAALKANPATNTARIPSVLINFPTP